MEPNKEAARRNREAAKTAREAADRTTDPEYREEMLAWERAHNHAAEAYDQGRKPR